MLIGGFLRHKGSLKRKSNTPITNCGGFSNNHIFIPTIPSRV